MNGLISIGKREIGGHHESCVNGRDLHEFLEVGKDFTNWIKRRIEKYNFQENQDFVFFAQTGEKPNGGRPMKGRPQGEYALTLDMAKELCMIERNEKGRVARKYFIECEKRLRAVTEASVAWDAGRFSSGLRAGIALSRALDRHGLNLADAAALVWYRKQELTQAEVAELFGMSKDRIKRIERILKGAGVELPMVHAPQRTKRMRELLNEMLGFQGADLQLLQGGAS